MPKTPRQSGWVTFLSDYGLEDNFVGVCKGVMARVAREVRIIDVCHLINPQDVAQGATVLASSVPYLPVGVHLALVDPLQESPVQAVVVVAADGSCLVGPDNGVLSLAWDALGGATAAYAITNSALWLDTPSRTFRGRDIYAPVTAHLAAGLDPAEVGEPVPVDDLTRVEVRDAVVDDDHVHAEVRNVDHFGNLSLNIDRTDLEAAGMSLGDTVELRCGGRSLSVPFTLTYGEVSPGRLTLCEDSFRAVMVAVNLGDAAKRLRLRRGEPVVISRAPLAPTAPAAPIGM